MTLREEARQALRVYQSRTGLSLLEISDRTGYAYHSIRQFASGARYGDGEGELAARALMAFFEDNPPAVPALPGKLYPTECTRAIDGLLDYVVRGRCGILYGPAGSQKSFDLKHHGAQAARDVEPRCVYIECSPKLTPVALLRRIAAALGAPYAQHQEGLLQSVLYTVGRRHRPVALLIDEAQRLCRAIDTFDMVRDVYDKAEHKVGILISGNEGVFDLFAPRPRMNLESWRSRAERKRVRLIGLSEEEAQHILHEELGSLGASTVATFLSVEVEDPETGRKYFSARRLFDAIEDYRDQPALRGNKAN